MSRWTSGWVIAGVIILGIIALAVTGIVNFAPATTTPPTSTSALVQGLNETFESASNLMHNVPLLR